MLNRDNRKIKMKMYIHTYVLIELFTLRVSENDRSHVAGATSIAILEIGYLNLDDELD